jgi:hypothetical protein
LNNISERKSTRELREEGRKGRGLEGKDWKKEGREGEMNRRKLSLLQKTNIIFKGIMGLKAKIFAEDFVGTLKLLCMIL